MGHAQYLSVEQLPFLSQFLKHVVVNADLKSTRIAGKHSHDFIDLACHTRPDLQFEARMATLLVRQDASPATYSGHGVVSIYAVKWEALYGNG